jgi:Heavy metal binding domain
MKKQFLTLSTAILFLFVSAAFVGCGGNKDEGEGENGNEDQTEQMEHNDDHDQGDGNMEENHDDMEAAVYACPMHPEITGQDGDKCSECDMDLKLVEHEHGDEEEGDDDNMVEDSLQQG